MKILAVRGKNLAIISRSGGHAVIAADATEIAGFNLGHFPESFLRQIEQHFRASVIRLTNPLDLGERFHNGFVRQPPDLPQIHRPIVDLGCQIGHVGRFLRRQANRP